MCSGPEHLAMRAGTGQPSYCTLHMFHAPRSPNDPVKGLGYISDDGHLFECNKPVVMQQTFHVIFIVDRSTSMSSTDRRPLPDAPMTKKIQKSANNRLGARPRQTTGARPDAYSLIIFNEKATNVLTNDSKSSPDQLLRIVLRTKAGGSTNFLEALRAGQAVMERNWSTERMPIMIFLSDGESDVPDSAIQDVCRSAVRLGKPLSFHSISFGPDSSSSYLWRMANLALEIQNNAPRDPLMPQGGSIPSSFSIALDTVRLAETFLGIAESLRKPRGSLIR
ncbi:hypothetical protein F5148DRAFT_1174723 [Russula earlei]|uniref:Uncharacterized protein n=1 Tax=Russula earlei TaxID=71964 RepID=A0ACC0UHN2_9AGAM|nr:hypothetical protein F5148DRAFT_1174723 [Russula earlei]